jgi:hypothetical protein
VELNGFSLELAAGVTAARLAEIDARKAWLNENIPSFKVSHLNILFFIYYKILKGKGEISPSSFWASSN